MNNPNTSTYQRPNHQKKNSSFSDLEVSKHQTDADFSPQTHHRKSVNESQHHYHLEYTYENKKNNLKNGMQSYPEVDEYFDTGKSDAAKDRKLAKYNKNISKLKYSRGSTTVSSQDPHNTVFTYEPKQSVEVVDPFQEVIRRYKQANFRTIDYAPHEGSTSKYFSS